MLKLRNVDCVCRFPSHRKTDFRRGQRLGNDDHIVTWNKPMKPRNIDRHSSGNNAGQCARLDGETFAWRMSAKTGD
jgi:hypothetical protein